MAAAAAVQSRRANSCHSVTSTAASAPASASSGSSQITTPGNSGCSPASSMGS